MSILKLSRWSGIFLILGGIYVAIFGLAHTIGLVLLLIGLIGVHIQEGDKSGKLNLWGLSLIIFGTVIVAGMDLYHLSNPNIASPSVSFQIIGYSLADLTLILGFILFGIAIARAGVYLYWSGYALGLTAALTVVSGGLLLSVALIWLGYQVIVDKKAGNEKPVTINT
jgi:hypothetical protein